MLDARLPPDMRSLLDAELRPSETVLWAAQPSPGRMARQGACLSVFGVPFTVFALIWTAGAGGLGWIVGHGFGGTAGGAFSLFGLFGVPFILVGLGLLSAPFWMAARARRTVYAVTDTRVLIVDGGFWGSFTTRSVPPAELSDRTRTQQADGSGDLLFSRLTTVRYDSDGDRTVNKVGFYGIPDVRAVDALIGRTFDKMPPQGRGLEL